MILTTLLVACGVPAERQGECSSDGDCGSTSGCKAWRCEQHACVEENAPAGSLSKSSFEAPPCHRLVCDGEGDEKVELDTTYAPKDTPGDCRRNTCNASGDVEMTIDTTDEPPDDPGDCMKRSCDAKGDFTEVPANDPPTGVCMAYTCMDGAPMGTPANEGVSCAPQGFVCGATGQCDTCPAPDAACTDLGPGAGSHSLGTAHGYGSVGWCDYNGSALCGAVAAGVTAYYGYQGDGTLSTCEFDPYVHVQATAPVRLCEYFDCPSVSCSSGSSPATLSGLQGCCAEGSVPSLKIVPSCTDSQVYMTVEPTGQECTSYELDYHT